MDTPVVTGANDSTKDSESRLRRFLHYGSEARWYQPCGNLKFRFEPRSALSIEELLRDDEWATKIVPTIEKVNQQRTSIAPCAILYALAMVIRKARTNMEKKRPADDGTEVGEEDDEEDEEQNPEVVEEKEGDETAKPVEKTVLESESDEPPSDPSKTVRKRQKWDLVIRDAYKVVRKVCEGEAENLFLFTHYLRKIAITEGKKGFGQGWRETMRRWYNYQNAMNLAHSATKIYKHVHWTHKDILKLLRWKYHKEDESKDAVFLYILYNFDEVKEKYENSTDQNVKRVLKHLKLIDKLRHANLEQALECVKDEKITIDFVPPFLLKHYSLWSVLIPRMTHEEVLSVICRISRLKLFKIPDVATRVVQKLEELNQPKPSTSDSTPTLTLINPHHVFITRKRYEEGPNLAVEFQYLQRRAQNQNQNQNQNRTNRTARETGNPQIPRQPPPRRDQKIVNCLNTVFNNSISSFAATGKRFLIGIDAIAANASSRCLYERFVSLEEATLLIALGVIRAEPVQNVKLVTFMSGEEFIREIPISVSTEGQVTKTTETMESLKSKMLKEGCMKGDVGGLIKWATATKTPYDVFIVLGDHTMNEGDAYEALKTYREQVHADAKLITCCLIGRHKKRLELTRPNMLLICGFDRNVASLIQAYSRNSF